MSTLGNFNPETKEWEDDTPEIENIALIQATADAAERKVRERIANKNATLTPVTGCRGTSGGNCL